MFRLDYDFDIHRGAVLVQLALQPLADLKPAVIEASVMGILWSALLKRSDLLTIGERPGAATQV